VEIFRRQFNVNQNLLFLIFGQMIPEGGFNEDDVGGFKSKTFKSMKT
jgi:hypothetical protein